MKDREITNNISINEPLLREILIQKLNEAHGLINYYLKTCTIYFAITGALLKFALDKNTTPILTNMLSWLGVSTTIVFFSACYMGHRVRKSTSNDINRLNEKLGLPLNYNDLPALKYGVITATFITSVILIGWFYILFNFSPSP